MVGVSCASPHTLGDMPFGVYKMSDIVRKGFQGSLDDHLEKNSVLFRM